MADRRHYPDAVPIISFLRHKDRYRINRQYQREADVWTKKMKQFLIDSIFKDYDIPKIYIRRTENEEYEIVDGQQRLQSIWEFADNQLELSQDYSGNLGGMTYEELSDDDQDQFDTYSLDVVYLENYSDDDVRNLFRRLQSGKPLNTAEKLNAFPGEIVLTMRELSTHDFFGNVVDVLDTRYRYYHLAAQMLLLEENGICDISSQSLYNFFDANSSLSTNSSTYREVQRVLNFLEETFRSTTPELGTKSWIITAFLFAKYLLNNYNIRDYQDEFENFFYNFYNDVHNVTTSSDPEMIEFAEAIQAGTTSQARIEKRNEVIVSSFLQEYPDLEPLDPQRSFTNIEKIALYRRENGTCEDCGQEIDFHESHAHHITPHSQGGKTKLENAKLLCPDCHQSLH